MQDGKIFTRLGGPLMESNGSWKVRGYSESILVEHTQVINRS